MNGRRIRRTSIVATSTVTLATIAGTLLVAAPVQAAPDRTHTAPVAVARADTSPNACYVTPRSGVGAVKIRKAKSVTSTPLGQINKGQRGTASCTASEGGSYSVSGCRKSNYWIRATYRGATGWVAWGCVDWYRTS
ncbi:hypothetical protein ACI2K4_06075 [Micromonospora sp. NPDC050397]|uniref:hypothetical protein n=1 Tax=Micromonospora sp. NPDC050397 TaxID=3364279 RepID=UPI00384F1136